METKSLKVSVPTWKKLNKMKFEYGYKNIDEIIDKLLDIVPASQIKEANKQ